MVLPVERGLGRSPDNKQIPQDLTHEDLVNKLGPDYQDLLNGKLYSLGLLSRGKSLEFNNPPTHKGSDALYLFEGVIGNHWAFVYFLEGNGWTSTHKHIHEEMEIVEDYHLLKGEMRIMTGSPEDLEYGLNDDVIDLDEDNSHFRIPPNTYHRAISDFAYVLVVMPDTASIPHDQLHTPPSK